MRQCDYFHFLFKKVNKPRRSFFVIWMKNNVFQDFEKNLKIFEENSIEKLNLLFFQNLLVKQRLRKYHHFQICCNFFIEAVSHPRWGVPDCHHGEVASWQSFVIENRIRSKFTPFLTTVRGEGKSPRKVFAVSRKSGRGGAWVNGIGGTSRRKIGRIGGPTVGRGPGVR